MTDAYVEVGVLNQRISLFVFLNRKVLSQFRVRFIMVRPSLTVGSLSVIKIRQKTLMLYENKDLTNHIRILTFILIRYRGVNP